MMVLSVFGKLAAQFRTVGVWASEASKWSNIRRLGSSNVMKMMIFMPVIGYILLFNKHILSFLEFYEPISRKYGVTLGGGGASGMSNLIYLYFGLLILGVSSVLYHIFSPSEVSQHESAPDYVKYMDQISSDLILSNSLDTVLYSYINSGSDDEMSSFYRYSPLSLPDNVSEMIHEFGSNVLKNTEFDIDSYDPASQIESNEDFEGVRFYTGSGYIDTQAVLTIMYQAPKVVWAYSVPLRKTAVSMKYDVLFLEYQSLNYSKLKLRILIGFMFLVGYVLVVVPTVKTSFGIISSLLI